MANPIDSTNPYQHSAVPPVLSGQGPASDEDNTGGLIPYKNPQALIAYYLGIFSLVPILGLLLAVPAVVLGILGLRARNRKPAIKGSVHAWIGIVMGVLMTLLWGGVVLLGLFAAISSGVRRM